MSVCWAFRHRGTFADPHLCCPQSRRPGKRRAGTTQRRRNGQHRHASRATDFTSAFKRIRHYGMKTFGIPAPPIFPPFSGACRGWMSCEVTGADFNVSARGDNQLFANKILVMVDGRSIYIDGQGLVFWKSLPVTLPEIKRIEVLRGRHPWSMDSMPSTGSSTSLPSPRRR